MKNKFWFLLIPVIILFIYFLKPLLLKQSYLVINKNIKVIVEVVQTPEERNQGLSGRKSLQKDHGMLFVFPYPGSYSFWMKEMLFPLDIIWIRDNKIVDLSQNLSPPQNSYEVPVSDLPTEPVNFVLEVTAGFIKEHNINVGDEVLIYR